MIKCLNQIILFDQFGNAKQKKNGFLHFEWLFITKYGCPYEQKKKIDNPSIFHLF